MNAIKGATKTAVRKYNAWGEQTPSFSGADTFEFFKSKGIAPKFNNDWKVPYATNKQLIEKLSEETKIPVEEFHKHHDLLSQLFYPKDSHYMTHRFSAGRKRTRRVKKLRFK